jgi:hypothetical protein
MYSSFSQGYSSVKETSRDFRLEDEVTKIDNGGLFAKERCQRLAKYNMYIIKDKYFKCMTKIMMEFLKPSLRAKC